MLAKLPVIGSPISCNDMRYAVMHMRDEFIHKEFSIFLSEFTQSRYIYLTSSGIASFYIILELLKAQSERREVILPAYTAGSLVVAILKAGLKPLLCDISLEDFNLDKDSLMKTISRRTLAVVGVHMFGIVMKDIRQLRKELPPEIFFIEDCAQAMGSRIEGLPVGSFSDVSFFSFNRGKNFPLYTGGFIASNSKEQAEKINHQYELLVKDYGVFYAAEVFLKNLAFSLTVNPFIYGMVDPFISRFKDTVPLKDFPVQKITSFQAALGLGLKKRMELLFTERYRNGKFLIDALKDVKGIILPYVLKDSWPVFNRLPVLFEDLNKMDEVEKKLWQAGIDTSRMYLKSLHRIFDLGYRMEDFTSANYFAQHLLTLPVHPLVKQEDLRRMADIIKKAL